MLDTHAVFFSVFFFFEAAGCAEEKDLFLVFCWDRRTEVFE